MTPASSGDAYPILGPNQRALLVQTTSMIFAPLRSAEPKLASTAVGVNSVSR